MAANGSSYNSSQDHLSCVVSFVMNTVMYSTIILLIFPLSVLVLCLGFQRCRRQRAASSPAMSHSDFFTYNLALMELVGVAGYAIFLYSNVDKPYVWVGLFVMVFPWPGQMIFPIFTCVDRYLAVVHPITYLRLKQGRGMRICYISAGFVWLFCLLMVGFMYLLIIYPQRQLSADICQTFIFFCFLIIVTFCCVSVLRTLIRPRPGEATADGVRADKSKRRAFHIILTIMVVLYLKFGGSLCSNIYSSVTRLDEKDPCRITQLVAMWFNLPSSLVLPLLYLHRAGPGCKRNAKTG